MFRSITCILVALVTNAAWAADLPRYEPPPAWVKPVDIPKPTIPRDGGSTRILLETAQDRFVSEGLDMYWERVERIETPQGLADVGNIAFDWNPDTETLLIHRARIIRGDKLIDLLAEGQKFIVLRRENKLEYAMLDGTLTAAIQPEGLQVGDILDLAIGYETRDPIMRGRSGRVLIMPTAPIDLLVFRELWPGSETPHWRETAGLDKPKISTTPDGTELLISMTNAVRPKAPKQAPERFSFPGVFEISEAGRWADVSALMSPYYDKAATLKADSPLRAEIAKIKASSNDPKVQAAAALHLVQDQVRYLFLGMNNGGFIPAAADLSWSRRFGDCKGKTVLLLALLRELGIQAEPALVNTRSGEELDMRPAMVAAFDHVIVRASVSGTTYWMDGTRSGDRALEDMQVPDFHWALPLRASGAVLEKLVVPPFDKPGELTQLRIDASAGIDSMAPVHADYILRGAAAAAYKTRLADMSHDDATNYLRDYWRKEYYWVDIGKVDAVYDEKTGEEHVFMDGAGTIPWKGGGHTQGQRYEADGAVLGWRPDYTRDAGPDQDAPYAVNFPYFDKTTETILLPDTGKGFTIEGSEVDKKIGAWEFKRTAKIEDGAFKMEAGTRAIVPEFPAADAASVAKELRDMADYTIYLRAPKDVGNGKVDTKSPKTVDDYLARARIFRTAGDRKAAIADFTQAILLKPEWGALYASRGIVYAEIGNTERAAADIDTAARLTPGTALTLQAQAFLDIQKCQYAPAIEKFTLAIAVSPNDPYSYEMRGRAFQSQDQSQKALSDYAAVLRLTPERSEILALRAEILAAQGEGEAALGEADKFVAAMPKEPRAHAIRGSVLAMMGRNAEAVHELDMAMAVKPSAELYVARAAVRADKEVDNKLADIDKALALDPHYFPAYLARADIYLGEGKADLGIKALDAAAKVAPNDLDIVRLRKLALEDNHQYDRAAADLNRLFTASPLNIGLLIESCRDKALSDHLLRTALADCKKALAINADIDEAVEWSAFIALRTGRIDDAIAGYDLFLKQRPNSPRAHFGRGVAMLRKHLSAQGEKDLAIARKANPNIDSQFAGYKRTPQWYGLSEQVMVAKPVDLEPATVNDFIDRGNELIGHREYRAALADLNRALDIDPKSAIALGDRGIAYYWLKDYEHAQADFDKAAEVSPLEAVALRGHGLLLLHNGDNKGAIAAFTQSIQYEPKNESGYDFRALAYDNIHDIDKSLADLDAVLRLRPDRTDIFARRSNAYYLSQKGDKALADADHAVALMPQDAYAHFTRARALKALKRRDEANAEYDRSIALQPYADTYLDRAQLNYDRPDQALADIDKALGLAPKSVTAYIVRANFYNLSGNMKQALADCEQGLSLAPDDQQARRFHMNLLAQDHQYARALKEGDALAAQAPDDAVFLNNLCWMRATWGQELPTALSNCNASLTVASSPATLDSRGLVYLRLGRLDEAVTDYDAAIKVRPKVASSFYGRGLAKLSKGLKEEGQADLLAALAINPKIEGQFADYGLKP
jgi:tetratricopeptide (TPR) repeat protein